MEESEIIRLVNTVINQKLAPILMGTLLSNQSQTRSTFQNFSSAGSIPNARTIQPFGLSSRSPANTSCLTAPIANDPTHVNILGHFDESRPTTNDGEAALYNAFGQLIYVSNGKIQIGSKSAAQNLVLGQIFKTFAASLLDLIANHTHPSDGFKPSNSADFLALKASPINDSSILSSENFTE